MRKRLLVCISVLSIAFSSPAFAESGQIGSFIQSLDERIQVESSSYGNGLTVTLDISDSSVSKKQEVHDFFWMAARTMNNLGIGYEFSKTPNVSFLLKEGSDVCGGFGISTYDSPWDFMTVPISLYTDGVCTALQGLFEHAYKTTFGGFDAHNQLDYAVLSTFRDKLPAEFLDPSFQRGVFWAYAMFDKSCNVRVTETSIYIDLIAQNTYEAGVEARKNVGIARSEYLVNKRQCDDSMPFTNVTIRYRENDEAEPFFTCTGNFANKDEALVTDSGTPFAEGFDAE